MGFGAECNTFVEVLRVRGAMVEIELGEESLHIWLCCSLGLSQERHIFRIGAHAKFERDELAMQFKALFAKNTMDANLSTNSSDGLR
mmetsp:Transcript_6363/g.16985  ORF Transcript_6363/g.16985 Transcript_6363/m.16985 type:complete len:87 (+) Transcript_6363:978-1238(+)